MGSSRPKGESQVSERVEVVEFEPPATHEEFLVRRERVIAEIEQIQDDLSVEETQAWRTVLIANLRKNQAELRRLKDWLRKNVKESEWTLLARAHALLCRIADEYRVEATPAVPLEETEALLDAIELVVPRQYLDKKGTENQ